MTPGDYASLAALAGHRVEVPWPFRDKLTYRAHLEPGTIRNLIPDASIETVALHGLYAIQHTVGLDRLAHYALEPKLAEGRTHESIGTPTDLPIVVQFRGRRYIHDGHHRMTMAWHAGCGSAKVRLIDLDAAAKKSSTKVQTLIFSKSSFTRKKAQAWAKTHDFKSGGVDETEDSYRIRQRDPSRFLSDSFRTVKLAAGVSATLGKLR